MQTRVKLMAELAVNKLIEQFDDTQVNVAAQMVAAGYDVNGIEAATGLEAGQFAILRQDERYKMLAQEAAQEVASEDLSKDQSWDSIESAAMVTLHYDLINHSHELTVSEKLAIADKANRARRRAGKLAEGNRGRGEGGVINGDVNNGTVINLHLPEVITDRLKKVSESNGQIYEHEKADAFDPAKLGARVELADVESVFGLDVTNPDRAFAEDDDMRAFDEILQSSVENFEDDELKDSSKIQDGAMLKAIDNTFGGLLSTQEG